MPPDRLERKCGQLSSLAAPLAHLAQTGDIIVDFCSGGGHLGLLVAHLLPGSRVHMVENKEESLARARSRGLDMGLDNVWFYQCNLEFYVGKFNIGLYNAPLRHFALPLVTQAQVSMHVALLLTWCWTNVSYMGPLWSAAPAAMGV